MFGRSLWSCSCLSCCCCLECDIPYSPWHREHFQFSPCLINATDKLYIRWPSKESKYNQYFERSLQSSFGLLFCFCLSLCFDVVRSCSALPTYENPQKRWNLMVFQSIWLKGAKCIFHFRFELNKLVFFWQATEKDSTFITSICNVQWFRFFLVCCLAFRAHSTGFL